MSGATSPMSSAETDISLLGLVPTRSTCRNVTLAVAAVLVLCCVWASPLLLRPSVGEAAAGQSSALGPHHEVLTIVSLQPDAWPWAELLSVGDVNGARVEGAWLVEHAMESFKTEVEPKDFATGTDFLTAALPGRIRPSTALPQRLRTGKSTELVMLWEITDCSELRAEDRVTVELRSPLHTMRQQSIVDFAAPGFLIDTLEESGTCPTS